MFYVSLNNININDKLNIPQSQLKKLSDYLTVLKPDETVSPRYLARMCNMDKDIIIRLLTRLSYRGLLGIKYIVFCDNEDTDMIHGYEFDNDDDLFSFVDSNDNKCPNCESNLMSLNIRVSFIRNRFIENTGEIYG